MQTGMEWAIYALALAVGIVYAAAVALWRHLDPEGSNTALIVVIHDGLVLGFVALLQGLEVAATVFAVLALVGVPQIIGYQIDVALAKRRRRLEL
jgi:hypothetical protein